MNNNLYEEIAGYRSLKKIGSQKPIFSAADVVGKTLYAKLPVQLKRIAADSAPVVYTVPKGGTVGVVASYLDAKPGTRSAVYWEFYDENRRSFFAKHDSKAFELDKLLAQGLKDEATKKKEVEDAGKSWWKRTVDTVQDAVTETGNTAKNITNGVIIAGGIVLVGMMVSAAMRRNRRQNFRNFYREASRAPRRQRATRTRKS